MYYFVYFVPFVAEIIYSKRSTAGKIKTQHVVRVLISLDFVVAAGDLARAAQEMKRLVR